MRFKLLIVLGLLLVLVDSGSVLAQRKGKGGFGGGGGFGGPGGGGGGGFDPSQMFDRFAQGQEVWVRANITNDRLLSMYDRITQALNLPKAPQITREQFSTGFQQMRANGGFGGGRGGGGPGGFGPGGPGGGVDNFDQMAERMFKQLDRNGDGYLNTDEMPNNLRIEMTRWDNNHDGLIDLNEYKAFLKEQITLRQLQNLPGQYETPDQEEDRRPVVYNASNYPKELPAWFKQLDVDNDGQIGLYEWRRAGKSLEEFEAMDRNDDGFLTVEEVLYAMALAKKSGKVNPLLVADLGPGDSPGNGFQRGPGGFGGKNGFGGKGGFGKGGFGGKGQGGGRGNFGGGPPGDQAQMDGQQRFGRGGPPGDNGNGGGRRKGKGGFGPQRGPGG